MIKKLRQISLTWVHDTVNLFCSSNRSLVHVTYIFFLNVLCQCFSWSFFSIFCFVLDVNIKRSWQFIECKRYSIIIHFWFSSNVHLLHLHFYISSIRKLCVRSERVHSRSILIKSFSFWVSCVWVLQGTPHSYFSNSIL